MTPNQIYKTAEDHNEIDADILFCHSYHRHEIASSLSDVDVKWENNNRVKVYEAWSFDCGDCRRDAKMWHAWLDNKPFMIVQAAGRDLQKDSVAVYVTDQELYVAAMEYLFSLAEINHRKMPCFNSDDDISGLNQYYGQEIKEQDLGLPISYGRQRFQNFKNK